MSPLFLLLSLLLYLGLLFLVALLGEGRARALAQSPWAYALSLAVYATAWTFFGSVGRAATEGATFLPIYLGPTLVLLLWPFLHARLLQLARAHRLTSWADYLYLRYGHPLLGPLAAAFLVVGLLPYLALQLKAIAQGFLFLSGEEGPLADVALLTALLLALFTVLFGTRRLDPSERHQGLVLAVAFESLVKLLALLLVGGLVLLHLGNPFPQAQGKLNPLLLPPPGLAGHLAWGSLVVLSGLAFLFLPRQFHVAVVENVDPGHLRLAAWAFPLYLLLINLPILPLALWGRLLLPGENPDLYVLALALEGGGPLLAALALLGGVSAATAMVVVEGLALSILISNHLLSPLLLRFRALGSLLLWRRLSILGVLLLAYLYFRLAGEAYALVGMGLISFVAVAQLAPPALLGLFWPGATRQGALAGLLGGMAVWAYTLFLPALARSGWLPLGFLQGPHPLLRPEGLLGVEGLDPVTHGFLASLGLNLALAVGVSLFTRKEALPGERTGEVAELSALLRRVLGPEAEEAFRKEASSLRGPQAAALAEAWLSGALGPATARLLLLSATREVPPEELVEEAARESKEVRAYARALEAARKELSEAYERLKALDQAKDELLAAVSHELKTPLTSVRALAEILEAHPDLPEEERRRFTALLAKEAARLSRLVEEVLAYTRLQAGLPLRRTPTDLRALAQEALALAAPLARERGVGMEAHLEGVEAPTDPDRVLQVLLNLLHNALRHARNRVRLELSRRGREAFFRVQDDGPGVAEGVRARVFEPFQSFSGGTGLGLFLARRLVEGLGGRIWLEEGQGGASFAFTLPLEVNHEDPGGGR
ncbi:MAG: ATP-binding protein [Thermus sp.]|uniref:ATP-binding protein n=1 Tax=Thermus sp. TaxID=275 RepID=UPI0025DE935D|nr:ATP-binding protein [Thermus sp.]MCS7217898.1 ATP-binding protein [Thermus sp.]MCX7850135.1 ATP-binding protein [Thermus sp.]MDW8016481.1 ATP-binding protein [Thermus sp.]